MPEDRETQEKSRTGMGSSTRVIPLYYTLTSRALERYHLVRPTALPPSWAMKINADGKAAGIRQSLLSAPLEHDYDVNPSAAPRYLVFSFVLITQGVYVLILVVKFAKKSFDIVVTVTRFQSVALAFINSPTDGTSAAMNKTHLVRQMIVEDFIY